MLLSEFNCAPTTEVYSLLDHCVAIKRWGEELVQHRPFSSIEALQQFAQQQAKTWTWSEIQTTLDTHPRIGEKQAKLELSEKGAFFSQREQASITKDEETLLAIHKGNIAYENRFGYIFLIKATSLNSEEILAALNYRLVNDPDTEKRIVHQQLLEIALLRLAQEVQA